MSALGWVVWPSLVAAVIVVAIGMVEQSRKDRE